MSSAISTTTKATMMAGSASVLALAIYRLSKGQARRSITTSTKLSPPLVEKRPKTVLFGKVAGENRGEKPIEVALQRDDPYFWLRDDGRTDPAVLGHLHAENAYAAQQTAHLDALRTTLYDEHLSHLKETDERPPYIHGDFFYYTRTVKGLSYTLHCRKPCTPDARLPDPEAKEEVLLDVNKLAEGRSQCVVLYTAPSPDHSKLLYAVDFTGDESYSLVIVELASGAVLDTIDDTAGDASWGSDDLLYYVTKDEAMRPFRIHRHAMGAPQADDQLLLEEPDELFNVGVGKSRSGRFMFCESASTETYEYQCVDLLAGPQAPLTMIQPRVRGLRYELDHNGQDHFIIWTNLDGAVHNRLMIAPVAAPGKEHWEEVLPYDSARMLSDVTVFKDFVVLEGRQDGLTQLWVVDMNQGVLDAASKRLLTFDEDLYEVGTSVNRAFDTPFVRIYYSSLTTPTRWLDHDTRAKAGDGETLIKEQAVLNFDRSQYCCKRIFATASDQTKVPMSIVYHKTLNDPNTQALDLTKTHPTMLYGYGSYGICIDPSFDARVLPLLDRGVVYVIAHVRGGGEMGRYWYEQQGKYLNKRNTFSDFISCAEHLVTLGVTQPSQLACEGRSAGGLLVGNVVNMRPDLFRVATAGVPFVDLMTTMCDPSIPLTTGEWEEWGNPNEAKYHDYMLSYSPVDNVRRQAYPHMLITAGLHDPRVAYWEPAKWAQRIRESNTNSNDVVCKFEMEAGHFSASDRYKYLREKSYDQAFVLDKLGVPA